MTLEELYRQLTQVGPQGGVQSAAGTPSSYSSGYDNAVRNGKAGTSTTGAAGPLSTPGIGAFRPPATGSFNMPDRRVAQGKGGNGSATPGAQTNAGLSDMRVGINPPRPYNQSGGMMNRQIRQGK